MCLIYWPGLYSALSVVRIQVPLADSAFLYGLLFSGSWIGALGYSCSGSLCLRNRLHWKICAISNSPHSWGLFVLMVLSGSTFELILSNQGPSLLANESHDQQSYWTLPYCSCHRTFSFHNWAQTVLYQTPTDQYKDQTSSFEAFQVRNMKQSLRTYLYVSILSWYSYRPSSGACQRRNFGRRNSGTSWSSLK